MNEAPFSYVTCLELSQENDIKIIVLFVDIKGPLAYPYVTVVQFAKGRGIQLQCRPGS